MIAHLWPILYLIAAAAMLLLTLIAAKPSSNPFQRALSPAAYRLARGAYYAVALGLLLPLLAYWGYNLWSGDRDAYFLLSALSAPITAIAVGRWILVRQAAHRPSSGSHH